jgi:hypothetical protein
LAKIKRKKKQYTLVNLPFSKGYMKQVSRAEMVIWGCVLAGAFLTYFIFDASFQKNSFISSGELSSGHANLEKQCESCHVIGQRVDDMLCSSCHEKTSIHTVYDFKAHYLYRSNDAKRLSPASLQEYAGRELPCRACHVEHRGKDADIRLISDKKCLACHKFGNFNKNHPEFDFARTKTPDDATLLMTHIRHTGFVLKEINGGASLDVLFQQLKMETMDFTHFFEQACLYCHNPDPDGRNFKNISFEKHCAQCHIKGGASVQGLPRLNPFMPAKPGVETIRQMQLRGGPGLSWVYASNPRLTTVEDGEVAKNPVYHKDPWIMENLKQIRQRLYPARGLFDLLETSGDISGQRVDTLYNRVIRTLQDQVKELQARPELKNEISKINRYLEKARQEMEMPLTARTKANFRFRFDKPNRRLSGTVRKDYLQLARDLTAEDGPECRKCHQLENATIARVQADQDVLIRAEFNHRAHILQKRCVECHTAISVDEEKIKLSVENFSTFKKTFPKAFEADRAATQNLPGIDSCKKCHSKEKSSNNCTTCHKFHPNKEHRTSLQLWQAAWR